MTETAADAAPHPSPVQLTISAPGGDAVAEVIAAIVWGGAGGIVPAPDGVEERDGDDGAVLSVISWVDPPTPEQLATLEAELRRCGATVVATTAVAHDAGLDGWRGHARVWRAGPFAVRPPWLEAVADAGVVDLVIEPGTTFGSGSHQSTRMALELIAAQRLDGAAIVDVGSGSGILGIGAALLGASRVELVELDPQGEDVGLANAALNRVGDRVAWAGSDAAALAAGGRARSGGQRPIVLANMLIGELEAVAPSLRALAGPGGLVIAAGVLGSQAPRLLTAVGPHRCVDSRIEPSVTDASVSWAAVALELEADKVDGEPGGLR